VGDGRLENSEIYERRIRTQQQTHGIQKLKYFRFLITNTQ
jgi:hypothetical protein